MGGAEGELIVTRTRAVARLATATMCLVAVVACTRPGPGHPPGSTTPTTAPAATVLVEFTAVGGFCAPPGCDRGATIRSDGTWVTTQRGVPAEGRLDAAATAALTDRIRRQVGTLATLKPSPGVCPVAYDGQNLTYSFHVGPKVVTVTNCAPDPRDSKVVPGDNALLLYIDQLIRGLGRTPPPTGAALVEWSSTGGDCRVGVCSRTARISADGSWVATDMGRSSSGRLDPATTAELTRRISAEVATLATLKPSDGECPANYDGQNLTFTFHAGDVVESVTNCAPDRRDAKVVPGDNALLLYTTGVIAALF
jgi:hypothetical protein